MKRSLNTKDFSGDMDDVNTWEKNPARARGVRTQAEPVKAVAPPAR